jgi:Flp pilus assembly protein TadD
MYQIFRFMKKTIIIAGILGLLGCSIVVMNGKNHAIDDVAIQHKVGLNGTSQTIFANKYGNYLAGRTASINGDHQNAAQFLGHIAMIEKQQAPKILSELAIRHYLLSGEIEKAITLAKVNDDSASKGKDDKKSLKNNGGYGGLLLFVEALKNDDFTEADARLNHVNSDGLASLFMPFLQSWLEFNNTKKPNRITAADGLAHNQFRNLQHYHEALQLELSGDLDKAKVIYEKTTLEPQKMPDAMLLQAINFFATNNQNEQAVLLVDKMRQLHPRDAFWYIRNTENLIEEIKGYEYIKIQSTTDGIAESLANIGYILANEGAVEEGQILLQLAIYLRSNNDLYKMILAESLENADNYDAAISLYEQIKQPEFIADLVQIAIARTLHASGEKQQSRQLLQQLLLKSPLKYNIQVMLGDLERDAKHDELALTYYNDALVSIGEPKNIDWPLLFRRSIIYDNLGMWEKSQADLQHALSLSPNEPELVNYLAYSWLLRGEKLEQAKEMLAQAVKDAPANAHIIDSYGYALYRLGEYDKAFGVLETALSLIPSDPTINDHYGDILWRLGRKTEAKFHWKRALTFKPTEKGAVIAIKQKLKTGLTKLNGIKVAQ